MKHLLIAAAVAAGLSLSAGTARAQSGVLNKAVGGYSFDAAAKESPNTKNFHSHKGKLTFAIITHTAGNGFFDPTYVGAKVAAEHDRRQPGDAGLGSGGRRHPARNRRSSTRSSTTRPSTASS